MSQHTSFYHFPDLPRLSSLLSGKTAHLAYGHFSVIHPGHVRYLKNARRDCDVLVVALRSDVSEAGSNRFPYNEKDRSYGLLTTNLCDFVVVLDNDNLSHLLSSINFKALYLGTEYDSIDVPVTISNALATARKLGVDVQFSSGELEYASTELFQDDINVQLQEKRALFTGICSSLGLDKSLMLKMIKTFQGIKLTIVGDTIIDEYAACEALGMSAEAPVIVVKELELQTFVGGAAIVAAHASALGADTSIISVVGNDFYRQVVESQLHTWGIKSEVVVDPSRSTTYKKRYMVENQKLFRVSKLDDHAISGDVENQFLDRISLSSNESRGIIFSDFAYGAITENVLQFIQSDQFSDLKIFADVQCSSQIASVTKYKDVDLICPNEREARLALQDKTSGIEVLSHRLMTACRCRYMIMKLDSKGFIAYHQVSHGVFKNQYFPALSVNPVDVTGAGDSLLAIISLCLSADIEFFHAAALSCFMCSIAVEQIGNKPISSSKVRELIDQYF